VELIRTASKTRDYTELDLAIREQLTPYLYNNGDGRYIPTSELIHVRRYVIYIIMEMVDTYLHQRLYTYAGM